MMTCQNIGGEMKRKALPKINHGLYVATSRKKKGIVP